MKRITVSTQILSGNLGDGWTDQNDAAYALAAYTERIVTDELSEFAARGYEIVVDVDVQRNTSGCSRSLSVAIDDDDMDHSDIYDLQQKIENSLTSDDQIWLAFCDSDEAAQFIA